MARKNQKLINYHTGKKTEMPSGSSVDFGEIVVRHNEEAPELLIKVGTDSFAVFQASGAVQTAINTAVSAAQSTLNTKVNSLSSATKTLIDEVSAATKATYATKAELEATSGSIITAYTTAIGNLASDLNELSGVVSSITENYVTNSTLNTKVTELKTEISTAKSEAVSSGKGYTDGQISAVTSAYTKADADLASSIEAVSGSVSASSATVVNDYATKVIASGYAMTAEANAVASGKGYTDGQISAVITAYTEADKDLDARIDKLEAISAHTQSAVQTASIVDKDTCKVSVNKVGTELQFNFENLVIDCGDF